MATAQSKGLLPMQQPLAFPLSPLYNGNCI